MTTTQERVVSTSNSKFIPLLNINGVKWISWTFEFYDKQTTGAMPFINIHLRWSYFRIKWTSESVDKFNIGVSLVRRKVTTWALKYWKYGRNMLLTVILKWYCRLKFRYRVGVSWCHLLKLVRRWPVGNFRQNRETTSVGIAQSIFVFGFFILGSYIVRTCTLKYPSDID